jgi:hypothetical protein
MQLSLTDNLFRNVKAGGVWLLALLSKTGMEKRARDGPRIAAPRLDRGPLAALQKTLAVVASKSKPYFGEKLKMLKCLTISYNLILYS